MRRDRPSATARKVALNIVSLGSKPGMDSVLPPGIVDATSRLLVASGVVSARAVRFARSRCAVAIYDAFDWMMPGQFEALAHRKAFCERQVRDGIGDGASQVLVLGAGYDTLGWRLARDFPRVHFFEIDHPATARRKAAGLARMAARDNLHLIAEDLATRRLVDVLAADLTWDRDSRSVVVAEGLTQYLPPAAVRDMFAQVNESVGAGSRIAFTYIGSGDDGRPDVGRWTGLVLRMLAAAGEPWLWSSRSEGLSILLEKTGWTEHAELAGGACRRGVEFFTAASKAPVSPGSAAAGGTGCPASASSRAGCSG